MDTAPSAAAARAGWRYGLMGAPVAFASVPLYVHLPHHYAERLGWPLASIGTLLLASRLADAVIDPALGRLVDRLHARGAEAVLALGAAAGALMLAMLLLLFLPPWPDSWRWPATTAVLLLACASASTLALAHQSWGTRLGGSAAQRSRVAAWREGLGLLGVLSAAVLPELGGPAALLLGCGALLLAGGWAWTLAPRPAAGPPSPLGHGDWRAPWRVPAFRGLLAVFTLNGLASALPATLVLFFIADRLQAPAPWPGALLALYFGAAALALPLWLRLVPRWGLARTWLAGMALSIATFAGTSALGAGDAAWFALVCLLAGSALGADLALPGALLAGVIERAGHRGHHDGAYLGWWQVATKLNLALGAGLVLPLLAALGYQPGDTTARGLQALTLAYCAVPCALKLAAAAALWQRLRHHPEELT